MLMSPISIEKFISTISQTTLQNQLIQQRFDQLFTILNKNGLILILINIIDKNAYFPLSSC